MEILNLLRVCDIGDLYASVAPQIEADSELIIRRFQRNGISREVVIDHLEELNVSLLAKIEIKKNFVPKFAWDGHYFIRNINSIVKDLRVLICCIKMDRHWNCNRVMFEIRKWKEFSVSELNFVNW